MSYNGMEGELHGSLRGLTIRPNTDGSADIRGRGHWHGLATAAHGYFTADAA